jgi:hypothetical protein
MGSHGPAPPEHGHATNRAHYIAGFIRMNRFSLSDPFSAIPLSIRPSFIKTALIGIGSICAHDRWGLTSGDFEIGKYPRPEV